ncbi:MAG: T9SS type A sorting domain-containing protein [bacterium]|nr:T9SS type A sorting domain-containing protein [bacterium]
MKSILFALLACLLPVLAFAQFAWQQDGVAIRQGAHLGWNGAALAAGEDVALFYYDCLRDGTRDVWGTRIAPSGEQIWGAEGRLVSGNISEQRAPVVAAYADGSVLVVWEDYAPGRFRDLMAQRYDANGNAQWSPASGVPVVQTERDQFDVRLALNDTGDAFIVFSDDRNTTGANTRLGAFAQVLTPNGERVGPLGGIELVDRVEGNNVPLDVKCVGHSAYVLVAMVAVEHELVIQKLTASGEIGFPGDEALTGFADYGQNVIRSLSGGLALAWTDNRDDAFGDARLTLLDSTRAPLPGWTSDGITIASGTNTQTIVNMSESPAGDMVVAVADYELEPDEAELTIWSYSQTGALNWGPVNLGNAALRTSPLDWTWQGAELVLLWTRIESFTEQNIRVQKLSANGTKLWGDDGHDLWSRTGKKLRGEIEQAADGPARVVIVSGRQIAQPESLLVGELSSSGMLVSGAEFISGGWTYDSYDPRGARIGERKIAVMWTDGRSRYERDVYYQLVDEHGTSQLEPQGRKIALGEHFSIFAPPTVVEDGAGGAFLAFIGDSLGISSMLQINRIDGAGNLLWSEPALLRSPRGYYGEVVLVPDGSGGVFAAYSRFNEEFVARISVAHVTASGDLDWPGLSHEFPGTTGSDAVLTDAVADGMGGCYLAGISGPWTNTDAVVFHVTQDGGFGEHWTNAGRSYGNLNERDRGASLLMLGSNLLVTYERPLPNASATYDVRGVVIAQDGTEPWGAQGRRLSAEDAAVVRHVLSSDGQSGFLLGYSDFRNGSASHPYVCRYNSDGIAQWSGAERLVCDHPLDQNALAMTHDGAGGAWLIWEDYRNSDIYTEIDLYAMHMTGDGEPATINGFTWPADGYPVCAIPTYQQEPILLPWSNGATLALWKDMRSSNPGRCCGAGAVGDLFSNVYAQVVSEVSLDTPDETPRSLPTSVTLGAYPNPFNPATELRFTLPQSTRATLAIYNLLGQNVATLLDAPLTAGEHVVQWSAVDSPSGLYFAKLATAGGESLVQKLTLVK